MKVKLNVIPRPTPKSRSHIVAMPQVVGPIFKGSARDVPQYCCGTCEAVLIEGIHAKQFIDASRPVEDLGATTAPLDLNLGDHMISATITVHMEHHTLVAFNGPLVLSCPACGSANEMISPNQLFDDPA
jgi:hypothetical protein